MIYFYVFLSVLVTFIAFMSIAGIKGEVHKSLAVLFGVYGIICLLYNITEYVIPVGCIFAFSYLYYLRGKNYYLGLTLGIMSVMTTFIAEILTSNVILEIYDVTVVHLLDNAGIRTFIFYVMFFLTTYLFGRIMNYILFVKLKITGDLFDNRRGMLVIIISFISLFVFYTTSILGKRYSVDDKFIRILSIINIYYFVTYTVVLFYSLKKMISEMELKHQRQYQESLKQYSDSIEQLYKETREFRHDYLNIFTSMGIFIENEDIKGLKEYFNKSILPVKEKVFDKKSNIALIENIKTEQLKGLIIYKSNVAKSYNLNFNIKCPSEIKDINMDIIDFVRIMGIILDNAIEGAKNSHNKSIELELSDLGNSYRIVVANTYDGNTDIDKIFDKGYSTKGENRGIGLSNLKKIVNQYDNVFTMVKTEGDLFIFEIIVNK